MMKQGVQVLNYVHSRKLSWSEECRRRGGPFFNCSVTEEQTAYSCCHCCEELDYVKSRIVAETQAFPGQGIFIDNIHATTGMLDYYRQISETIQSNQTDGQHRMVVFNGDLYAEPDGTHMTGCDLRYFDLADLYISFEGNSWDFPLEPTDNYTCNVSKLMHAHPQHQVKNAAIMYNALPSEWRSLLELARSQGYTKFYVGSNASVDPLGNASYQGLNAALPSFFEEMVDYIAGLNRRGTAYSSKSDDGEGTAQRMNILFL